MAGIGGRGARGAGLGEKLGTAGVEAGNGQVRAALPAWSEKALAHFLDHSRDMLCVAGFDGYFKRLTPAWTTRLGWTKEELLARPLFDLVHPDTRTATRTQIDKLVAGEPSTLFENRYRCADSSYLRLRWSAQRVPGRRRIYATARDVTWRRRLEGEILEIADLEKERLGQELHDGLCQSLAGIAALSSTLRQRLAKHDGTGSAAAAEITQLLHEAIGEARDMARGLVPLGLEKAGLEEALRAFAVNVRRMFRVSCVFACDRPLERRCPEVERHLFRIAQEAVHNAVIHGAAQRIEVGLDARHGEGLLSVRDNGVGLAQGGVSNGIGVQTMTYRAHLIGGSLRLRPRARGGTELRCTFPLADPSRRHEDRDDAGRE